MEEYIGDMKEYVRNMSIYWISHPPHTQALGLRKIPNSSPLYRPWDLKNYDLFSSIQVLGLRKILSLTSYMIWDLEKFRPLHS